MSSSRPAALIVLVTLLGLSTDARADLRRLLGVGQGVRSHPYAPMDRGSRMVLQTSSTTRYIKPTKNPALEAQPLRVGGRYTLGNMTYEVMGREASGGFRIKQTSPPTSGYPASELDLVYVPGKGQTETLSSSRASYRAIGAPSLVGGERRIDMAQEIAGANGQKVFGQAVTMRTGRQGILEAELRGGPAGSSEVMMPRDLKPGRSWSYRQGQNLWVARVVGRTWVRVPGHRLPRHAYVVEQTLSQPIPSSGGRSDHVMRSVYARGIGLVDQVMTSKIYITPGAQPDYVTRTVTRAVSSSSSGNALRNLLP